MTVFLLECVKSGIHQGAILESLIYINNLTVIISNPKPYPNDAYKFSIVLNINILINNLSNDFDKISGIACQYKISFNQSLNKQAEKVIFT